MCVVVVVVVVVVCVCVWGGVQHPPSLDCISRTISAVSLRAGFEWLSSACTHEKVEREREREREDLAVAAWCALFVGASVRG